MKKEITFDTIETLEELTYYFYCNRNCTGMAYTKIIDYINTNRNNDLTNKTEIDSILELTRKLMIKEKQND